jgi:hypothetical protein
MQKGTTNKQQTHDPSTHTSPNKYSAQVHLETHTALRRNNSLVVPLTEAPCTRWRSACQYTKLLSHQDLGKLHSNRTLTHAVHTGCSMFRFRLCSAQKPLPEKRSKQHHRCCLHSCKLQQGAMYTSHAPDPALLTTRSTHQPRQQRQALPRQNPTTSVQ